MTFPCCALLQVVRLLSQFGIICSLLSCITQITLNCWLLAAGTATSQIIDKPYSLPGDGIDSVMGKSALRMFWRSHDQGGIVLLLYRTRLSVATGTWISNPLYLYIYVGLVRDTAPYKSLRSLFLSLNENGYANVPAAPRSPTLQEFSSGYVRWHSHSGLRPSSLSSRRHWPTSRVRLKR